MLPRSKIKITEPSLSYLFTLRWFGTSPSSHPVDIPLISGKNHISKLIAVSNKTRLALNKSGIMLPYLCFIFLHENDKKGQYIKLTFQTNALRRIFKQLTKSYLNEGFNCLKTLFSNIL